MNADVGRRLGGLVLVVVVVVAVVAVAASRPLAGTPTAPPLSVEPSVGDCLLSAPSGAGWDDGGIFGSGGSGEPAASADLGPCTGPRFGEVVAVQPAQSTVDDQFGRWQECDQAAVDYLAVPYPNDDLGWHPTIAVRTGFLWPSRRQVADGQHWVACALAVPSAVAPFAPEPVLETLRGGWSDPRLRDRLGICRDEPLTPVPCATPHRFEALAWADLTTPVLTQETLERGCREQVAAQTRMPDITAAGTLTVGPIITVAQDEADGGVQTTAAADLDAARALDPPAVQLRGVRRASHRRQPSTDRLPA